MPRLNLPLLIIILPTIAILLTLLILALNSSSSFTFPLRTRHGSSSTTASVRNRKSWDSLNVFLVLFAILCGVFARRNNNDDSHAPALQTIDDSDGRQGAHSQWYSQYSEQKFYEEPETTSVGSLKRNSSSYPDLRQESLRETGNDRLRFLDDFELGKGSYSPASPETGNCLRISSPIGSPREKEIQDDTVSWKPKSATPHPPPPLLPPPTAFSREPKGNYETIPCREKEIKELPQPPPPPPSLPPLPPQAEERKSERRNGRKRSNATKEIKSVLTSLYNSQRKRKKKYKLRNSSKPDEPAYPPPEPEQPSLTRPPPPPPPPPPSLFHGFFRKGSKTKRIHSLSAPPLPPPPPPPAVTIPRRKDISPKPAPPQETSRRSSAGASWRPPLPTPARASAPLEELDNFGGQSPLIPMPPPPPPSFKVPGFRFVVRGDYVKVRSASSSLCSSPDRDEIEPESTDKVNAIAGGGGWPVSCPSPDVNVKADTFIARLRDGWRLEKMRSVKGRVYLGPSLGPI